MKTKHRRSDFDHRKNIVISLMLATDINKYSSMIVSSRKIVPKANWTRRSLSKSTNNSIRLAKQINFVRMFLKHSILIIQEKSVRSPAFVSEKGRFTSLVRLDFVEFLIAISVTSHGDIREKLNMAFNMYGE